MIDSQVVAFTFVVAALTFTPGADTMREGAGQPCNRRARPYIMLDDQGPEKPPDAPCSMTGSRQRGSGGVFDDHRPSSIMGGWAR